MRVTDSALQRELDEVNQRLEKALADLRVPLADLVRSQLADSFSVTQAGIVLTAALGEPDSTALREQRILLAAAIEMLRLALRIHRMLLATTNSASAQEVDKTRAGSVILAGDYCFSRAAILAAATESPEVVKIFANALKRISEAKLRPLLKDSKGKPYDEPPQDVVQDDLLLHAGVAAAAQIAKLAPGAQQTIIHATERPSLSKTYLLPQLPPHQQRRWRSLFDLYSSENQSA